MKARLRIAGTTDVVFEIDGESLHNTSRWPVKDAQKVLGEVSARYRRAVIARTPDVLAILGTELFDWLDRDGRASAWVGKTVGALDLEIAVSGTVEGIAQALLDAPWELLAKDGRFLAADSQRPFLVTRRIGPPEAPVAPPYTDLRALFMAAAPEGQRELDYEAEEAAILSATERLRLQLLVEESGCLEFLGPRVADEESLEVLHLSCHGDIDSADGPFLALETPEGGQDKTTAARLSETLGTHLPGLVVLSACRTAERGGETDAAEPFTRRLIQSGVPNVLGWDGSVHDLDATDFAARFYERLAARDSVPHAAAAARRALLRDHLQDPQIGQHWHLARLYLGPRGGGALCRADGERRPFRRNAGQKEFLDAKGEGVPVAAARAFVGRRREAQAILRAFADGDAAGVLIHGMGNLGKSSLAARIAQRRPDLAPVVIFERYDAEAVFGRLIEALPPREREGWAAAWGSNLGDAPEKLGDALEAMLTGPFDANPILLVIDDLERLLEAPKAGYEAATPVKSAYRAVLAGVIRAFCRTRGQTRARLLLTSRFTFTLPDGLGGDWADRLRAVPLTPMSTRQREKQFRAARALAGPDAPGAPEAGEANDEPTLRGRLLATAAGNPGLQDLLTRPLLAGEREVAERAVAAVEHWRKTGEAPAEDNAAQAFFARVALKTYREALTEPQTATLRANTLFEDGLPVPRPALAAVAAASGVADPEAALDRLLGLGLLDDWGAFRDIPQAAANTLARPLAGNALGDSEVAFLSEAALEPLAKAWTDEDGDFPFDPRGIEAARLALAAPDPPPETLDAAARAAGSFLFRRLHSATEALAILRPAAARLRELADGPGSRFLLLAANCAERIGETAERIGYLEEGMARGAVETVEGAQLAVLHAEATVADNPERALDALERVAEAFRRLDDERSRAVTMGRIADIKQARGDPEEALRIRLEEELPVYERLGDVREKAVSLFKCAQIRLQKDGLTPDIAQTIHDELAESFSISLRLQLPDGIGHVGALLGQVLAAGGLFEKALEVLELSAAAFDKLGHQDLVQQVRDLIVRVDRMREGNENGN